MDTEDPQDPFPEARPKPETSRLLAVVAVLYLASLVAGVFLLWRTSPSDQPAKSKTSFLSSHKTANLAIVNVYGVIRIEPDAGPLGSGGSDQIVKQLHKLKKQPEIKAVVLRINSPGGSVAAVQEIYDEIMELRKSGKKVVASFGDVAASGGYYIASAADKIVANPGTITGSIGDIMHVGNTEELFRKIGVRVENIKSGIHKDIGSPSRSLTPQERELLQVMINDAYVQFTNAIVTGRKMDKAKVLTLADGRIFTGAQALSAGLVDALGNREKAIQVAKELSGIEGEPRLTEEQRGLEKFLDLFSKGADSYFRRIPLEALSPERFGHVRFEYIWE